ncbi:MAG: hypothetical protein GXO36_00725 [Chloroflexi bacterium]|nr:hypothetical protein [Chloroflexota bacterium]
MRASVVQTETYLTLDIGATHTRAYLFDVADGMYRLVALGHSNTTAFAPLGNPRFGRPVGDVWEGARRAIEHLESLVGFHLLDEEGLLSVGTNPQAPDQVFAMASFGAPVRAVLMGVLPTLSLASLERVVAGTYSHVVAKFSAVDAMDPETRLTRLVEAFPDVVALAGGTDQGAESVLLDFAYLLQRAAQFWPLAQRPWILYAGNANVAPKIERLLGQHFEIRIADNVRPKLTEERLGPARRAYWGIVRQWWVERYPGLDTVYEQAQGRLTFTAEAFRRAARILHAVYAGQGSGLALDVGSRYTYVRYGPRADDTQGRVFPWGLGEGLAAWLDQPAFWEEVSYHSHLDEAQVRNFLYQKRLYPDTLPMSEEELHLEEAVAEALMGQVLRELDETRTPALDFALVSGSVFRGAPSPGRALLTALNGLQPRGITVLLVDLAGVVPSLGVLAEVNQYAAVHLMGSVHLAPLAVVISPRWRAGRRGAPGSLGELTLTYSNGESISLTLQPGLIQRLPLAPGRMGSLSLIPHRRVDLGAGYGEAFEVQVPGALMGVIIDNRGRPLPHEALAEKARWLAMLPATLA